MVPTGGSDLDPAIQISAGNNQLYGLLAERLRLKGVGGFKLQGQLPGQRQHHNQPDSGGGSRPDIHSFRFPEVANFHAACGRYFRRGLELGRGWLRAIGAHRDWSNHHTAQKIAAYDNVAKVAAGYLIQAVQSERSGTVWDWGLEIQKQMGPFQQLGQRPKPQVGSNL